MFGGRYIAIAILILAAPGSAQAGSISGCAGATSKCTIDGTDYFCEDPVCPGGTCSPPSSDTCPGHCLKTPTIPCANDAPCNGTGNVCQGSGTIALCIAGSANAGELCYEHGDCNDPPGGTCDVSGTPCCSGSGGPPYLGDGKLTVCGSNSTSNGDSITLSTPPSGKQYVVCGRNGADTITGGDGADLIDGGAGNDVLTGGGGKDRLYGGEDDDTINVSAPPYYLGAAGAGVEFADGGPGDDDLVGSNTWAGGNGDDVLLGGDGIDYIVSGTGRDVLKGGNDDDALINVVVGTAPDDTVGSLLCGGPGSDSITGKGPSHQCVDGGSGNDSCTYAYSSTAAAGSDDLGTVKDCETVSGSVSSRVASCGCE